MMQTVMHEVTDPTPPPIILPAEITLQEAHHTRCEGLLVSIVGTCLQTPSHSNGAWAVMDGTGFAQVIQSEFSVGDSVAPVRCCCCCCC